MNDAAGLMSVGVRFRRAERALSRRVGADVLVKTPGDVDVHELSGGAMAVWAVLDTPRTLTELVDYLADVHATQPADIADDVEGCVLTLMAFGVVEEVPDVDG